jgi:hypothetical protein
MFGDAGGDPSIAGITARDPCRVWHEHAAQIFPAGGVVDR